MQTSRIRLALSSVQLFIERILRNLEPQVQPADLATLAAQWPWMKRYRVWQANREVFLWPENWLYPELRDDQSPLFKQTMSALLQGDINQDTAAAAISTDLTGLEEVAKLEPCGLFFQPGNTDEAAQESAYVVARTAGAHRKYYFRELQYDAWSPWTEVNIDCEDMPLTPVVWNGRLFLFWLKLLKQSPSQATSSGQSPTGPISGLDYGEVQTVAQGNIQAQRKIAVQAMLCWSEFYNGVWQPTKTSEISRPTTVGTFDVDGADAIEASRNLMRISPVTLAPAGLAPIPSDGLDAALILAIGSPLASIWPSGGFVLYNTHSLPVRFEDIWVTLRLKRGLYPRRYNLGALVATPASGRDLSPIQPYSGGNAAETFGISYWTSDGGSTVSGGGTRALASPTSSSATTGSLVMSSRSSVLATLWDAPFFYEDRQHLFYVSTSETIQTINRFNGFGALPASAGGGGAGAAGSGNQTTGSAVAARPDGNFHRQRDRGGGNPVAIQGFLAGAATLRTALGDADPVTYQGPSIRPGARPRPARTKGNDRARVSVPSRDFTPMPI